MCIIENDDVTVNDDGTVSVSCYCGWVIVCPTADDAIAAAWAHIDAFDEREQLYGDNPAASAECCA